MNRRHLFRSLLGMACAPLVAVLPRVKPSAVADYDTGTVRFDEPPAKGESISYAHSQHATSVHTFRITATDPGTLMGWKDDCGWVVLSDWTDKDPPIRVRYVHGEA